VKVLEILFSGNSLKDSMLKLFIPRLSGAGITGRQQYSNDIWTTKYSNFQDPLGYPFDNSEQIQHIVPNRPFFLPWRAQVHFVRNPVIRSLYYTKKNSSAIRMKEKHQTTPKISDGLAEVDDGIFCNEKRTL
jgi:hypothetical protein